MGPQQIYSNVCMALSNMFRVLFAFMAFEYAMNIANRMEQQFKTIASNLLRFPPLMFPFLWLAIKFKRI